MNNSNLAPEHRVMQFILSKWISKPIFVAAKLGIPDHLDEGSKSIDELAALTGTLPGLLYRMMRALAGVGIFRETENRCFSNTPLSKCLIEGRLKSAGLLFNSDWHNQMWDNLLYSIQTGKPAFEKITGEPAFEWFDKNPVQAKTFHEANSFKASSTHRTILDVYDFTDICSITDVGGGFGSLLAEILMAHPHMTGVVAELPEVIPVCKELISKSNLENRMKVVECNFFQSIPGGSDAYLLSHILHDWPDNKCITILKNCRRAMKANSRLIIVEGVIPEGNEFSINKFLDLEVLLMGGGKERTEHEFHKLLAESGFRLERIIATKENISVIETSPD